MDLVKIGSYIAEKRKKLGMTQKQLAEKLGKSDKSVSKWERGICLPDVSVYLELCEILGISLNEFLAGEDIEVTNVEKKSEDTLIQISKDSSHKQRYLKKIIAILLIAVGVFAITLGIMVCNKLRQPQNYIEAVDPDSVEMKSGQRRNFETGILTNEPTLVEAAINQFDEVWRGKFCAKCGRKSYCNDQIR